MTMNYQHQPERDDPWEDIGAIAGKALQRLPAEPVPSLNSSPKFAHRQPINPEIMEMLAELAARFPKGGDEAAEEVRLRLLAEDLSANLKPDALAYAIRNGVGGWHFLPKLAQIMDEAKPFIEHQRWSARHKAAQARIAEQRTLAAPIPQEPVDNTDLLAALRKKLDAADAEIRNTNTLPPEKPLSWQILEQSGEHVSPGLKALVAQWKEKAA
jgi:hypothetical protein